MFSAWFASAFLQKSTCKLVDRRIFYKPAHDLNLNFSFKLSKTVKQSSRPAMKRSDAGQTQSF